jgi:NAD(P)-dependent dehydrogenase (short-subunit alcohol dehydrogenase family)
VAYEATKAAQVAVSRHIAVRYAKRGIRSNALMLGLIDSTMVRREYGGRDGLMEKRAAAPPMKRQGTPEEVAAAAAFLASDDASYVNGTVLVVDGGLTSV